MDGFLLVLISVIVGFFIGGAGMLYQFKSNLRKGLAPKIDAAGYLSWDKSA